MENSRPDSGSVPVVNVAIYARDAQGDPSSLDDQISACKSYADRMGWRIVHIYTDAGVSGATTTARPGIAGLLDSAQRRPQPFGRVLTPDTSRLGRDMAFVRNLIDELKFHGVSVTFVEQGLDSDSKGFDDLLGGYAAKDAAFLEDLSHVVRRSQKACVMNGFVHGGRSYGYDHVPVVDSTRKVGGRPMVTGFMATINPAEAAVVRCIFELRASGLSYCRIALLLNADDSAACNLRKWSSSTVHAIISNPVYLGRVLYGRTRRLRNPYTGKTVARPVPQAEWLVREAPDRRIVSDELWRKAHGCPNRWGGSR